MAFWAIFGGFRAIISHTLGVDTRLLPILLGGAKELGIVHINRVKGAKEPRNLQNHRGDYNELNVQLLLGGGRTQPKTLNPIHLLVPSRE